MASFWGKSSKFQGSWRSFEKINAPFSPCSRANTLPMSKNKPINQQNKILQQNPIKMRKHATRSGKSYKNLSSEHKGWSFWSNLRPKKVAFPHLPILNKYWRVIPLKNIYVMRSCQLADVNFSLWYIYPYRHRSVIDRTYCTYHFRIVKDTHFRRQFNQQKSTLNWIKKTNMLTLFAPPTANKLANLFQNVSFMAFLKSDLSAQKLPPLNIQLFN